MSVAVETLIALLAKEAADNIYGPSEQIRNAALYYMMDHDANLTTKTFAEACAEMDISYGTAKARLNDVRRFMKG
jgi:hypothetical protein